MEKIEIILIITLIVLITYIFISNLLNINQNYKKKNIENFEALDKIIPGLGTNTDYESVFNMNSLKLYQQENNGETNNNQDIHFYLNTLSNKKIVGQLVYNKREEMSLSKKFQVIEEKEINRNIYDKYKIVINNNPGIIQISNNAPVSNAKLNSLDKYYGFFKINLFDNLDKLKSIIPKIKNSIENLFNDRNNLRKINEEKIEAESKNQVNRLTRLNRRIISIDKSINENICYLQSIILEMYPTKCDDNEIPPSDDLLEPTVKKMNKFTGLLKSEIPQLTSLSSLEELANINYNFKFNSKIQNLNNITIKNNNSIINLSKKLNKNTDYNLIHLNDINLHFKNLTIIALVATTYSEDLILFNLVVL